MANIWRKDDNVKEQPKRNIMDLSFQNNLTTQFGKLVPVFCKEFIPGDSFSIKPTFSLKFQPMVFPIQTRMRAHLHFFKVRNRNLWKDWEDFIAKNKENLDPPYLDTGVTQVKTGSLLDYLGVPTTLVGAYGNTVELPYDYSADVIYSIDGLTYSFGSTTNSVTVDSVCSWFDDNLNNEITIGRAASSDSPSRVISLDLSSYVSESQLLKVSVSFKGATSGNFIPLADVPAETQDDYSYVSPTPRTDNLVGNYIRLIKVLNGSMTSVYLPSLSSDGLRVDFEFEYDTSASYHVVYPRAAYQYYSGVFNQQPFYQWIPSISLSYTVDGVNDISFDNTPYWWSGDARGKDTIKLSALPCRAYEQIYNSFYRNAENNPYILNGVPEYNKYMPTDEGGVDVNLYDFYYRNWEDDFLTTALQQPQAGIAPLVGLTGTAGTATVTLSDEDGNTSEATASYDEEGNVTSVAVANNTSLTEALAEAVTYGISINDLRNVNAFQRWLEAKARGGYKYRDVIETMFGISVRYDTLDMPEFIGGTSIDIMVNQISQTTPTETSPLGDYAGQAAGIGTGQTINEYFDEHGFVIGILSVVPVPNYSQLLPKHFIKRDAFDYYFPQFGHIGMQPIKYNEVCPVQSYQESTEQNNVLDETFGYQRAWYDYLASTDEVHGEFRTNLRDFVMNRTFDVKPELVNDFLTVDPSQLNDVFAIQDGSYDKILGQIYFDVKAKRPIPLYGIPKLE